MKIDKKKVVFGSIVTIVLIFIVSYTMLVLMKDDTPNLLKQTELPELKEVQETYESKLEALNDIEEERERTIPKMYSEALLDSLGIYETDLQEEQRVQIIDSFYRYASASDFENPFLEDTVVPNGLATPGPILLAEKTTTDFLPAHEAFFLAGSGALKNSASITKKLPEILAAINGDQTVRTKDRLELILREPAWIGGVFFPFQRTIL